MNSSRTITPDDARIIRALVDRGWAQHDVASLFGCNQGRVAEVIGGTRHPGAGTADLRSDATRARLLTIHSDHALRVSGQMSRTLNRGAC